VDATNVFWTDPRDGTVNTVPKAGGPTISLATGQAKPIRLTLDSSYVYWSNNLGGAIMRTRKDGTGSPQVVAAAPTPWGIWVDSTYVYWTQQSSIVWRAPKSGGSPTQFANLPRTVLTDGVSDGTALFLPDYASSVGTYRVDLATATVTTLLAFWGSAAATDSSRFYFAPGGRNCRAIGWMDSVDGGGYDELRLPAANMDICGGPMPSTLATNSCGFVWGGPNAPTIGFGTRYSKYPLNLIATTTSNRVALDDSFVYWTDSTGAIGKVPVP
jgi:hypothetical protein